jgi:hypothetical protein
MTKQHPSIAPAHHGFFVVLAEEVHPCMFAYHTRTSYVLHNDGHADARSAKCTQRKSAQKKKK